MRTFSLLSLLTVATLAATWISPGASAGQEVQTFVAPPPVTMDFLTDGKRDRLGNGWIVTN